jgi:hypothetical protein
MSIRSSRNRTRDFIVSLRNLFASDDDENATMNDFPKQIEAVYKGLGIPVLYGVLSVLANKSVFFIGGRGSGKTRIIKCIPEIEGYESCRWDTFTLGELDALCAFYSTDTSIGVTDKKFVFKVEEFSTLSEYHREIFLTVCSKIATDGDYQHVSPQFQHLMLENCTLSMLVAIQPRLYSKLCSYDQWDNMSYDRFTKFVLLNPLRRDNTVDTPMVPTLPREMSLSVTLPNNLNMDDLVSLFRGHVSEGRAQLYARDYATAMARFQGKNTVEQCDIDIFHRLFSPYLGAFSRLQHRDRDDLEARVTVASGHMELLTEIAKHLEGATKEHLAESMMVTTDHIGRCASYLLVRQLIREESGTYHLSNELEQFFNWYRDTFSVEMSPAVEGT